MRSNLLIDCHVSSISCESSPSSGTEKDGNIFSYISKYRGGLNTEIDPILNGCWRAVFEWCSELCILTMEWVLVWFLGLVEVLGWKSNEWVANPLGPGQTSALQIIVFILSCCFSND